MKNLILICVICLLVSGCSHNAVNYSDGLGFETTFRPDSGNFGFVFRYGKIFSAVLRENSEVEMNGNGSGGSTSENVSASSDGNVKVKIGKQITGYYVDALKAGATPEQIQEYMKQSEKNSK